jgi:predicted Zn-dependent protease
MPDGLSPLYEAAKIAGRRSRWEEGEKRWREFLSKAPAFHPAYHNLAIALVHQGRNAEAETHFRKAMELDPGYIVAPCALASLCLEEHRVEEARALLDKVIVPAKINPAAMSIYCLAQSQVAAEEKDMAAVIRWLDLATKVDPENQIVKKLRKRVKFSPLAGKILRENRRKN